MGREQSHLTLGCLGKEYIFIFWVVLFYLRDKAGWAVDLPEAGKGEGILPRVSRGDPLP